MLVIFSIVLAAMLYVLNFRDGWHTNPRKRPVKIQAAQTEVAGSVQNVPPKGGPDGPHGASGWER